ncbi:uncharacterized protein LOC135826325 [Sycon ciliatum]|uniref:uncharacterized protein LOC135826325 n=1 Tax=Sycon ciliatum TaxID=27933 RepID=UPI0031F69D2B
MSLQSGFGVTALLVALICLSALAVESSNDSCMARMIMKAGIARGKALDYEQRALRVPMNLDNISQIFWPALAVFLNNTRTFDARTIQKCIRRKLRKCRGFSPCANGGQCELSPGSPYDVSYEYVCKCQEGYHGAHCETPLPTPTDDSRSLEVKVAQLEKQVHDLEDKTKYLGSGCNLRTLGYKYLSTYSIITERQDGRIATIAFTKTFSHTVLKLSYSTSINSQLQFPNARWYFKIDGKECAQPTTIDIMKIQDNGMSLSTPGTLTGICESISYTGGKIATGKHEIAVHFENLDSDVNTYHGLLSTSLLEVQEMCPQF